MTEASNALAQAERAVKQALSHTHDATLAAAERALVQAEHAVQGAAGSSNPQAVARLDEQLADVQADLRDAKAQQP